MKSTPLFVVVITFSLFSFLIGCSKRVAPVSGAVEMELQKEDKEESGIAFGRRNRQSTKRFSGDSESVQEETIDGGRGRSQKGNTGNAAGASELKGAEIGLGDIFFDYNMAKLKGVSARMLRVNARKLLRHPTAKVRLSGHTDERGSSEYNLALGERRARTVKQFLEAFGIPSEQMEIISYGEEKPSCREHREFCWKKNRRVHFSVKRQG